MKCWKLEEPYKLSLGEIEPTETQPDHVKVKIERILLTKFDYSIYSGANKHKYPFVFGSNAVGVISEVGDDERSVLNKMDRVVIEPFITCGTCTECKNDDIANCSNMIELGFNSDGLMKNFVDVPATNVHPLPENLSDDKALFASYVAFCLNVVDNLDLEKGRHIAIFSSSKTGLILAQLVAYYQAVPVFISTDENLLQTARQYGIFYCFNPDNASLAEEINVITGGRMCKEIVFFSDSEFAMKDMYNVASQNAHICLAGYSTKESKLSVAQICQKHLTVFGVYNGAGNFASAINMLVTDTVKVDMLIGEKIAFDELAEQMQNITADNLTIQSKVITVD